MTEPTKRRTSPAVAAWAVSGWLVLVLVLSIGCQPETRPSTFDVLSDAEAALVTTSNALHRAVALGTISTDAPAYARFYDALTEAGAIMDRAWAAYRAGATGHAEALSRSALEAYIAVRPLIQNLAREP